MSIIISSNRSTFPPPPPCNYVTYRNTSRATVGHQSTNISSMSQSHSHQSSNKYKFKAKYLLFKYLFKYLLFKPHVYSFIWFDRYALLVLLTEIKMYLLAYDGMQIVSIGYHNLIHHFIYIYIFIHHFYIYILIFYLVRSLSIIFNEFCYTI